MATLIELDGVAPRIGEEVFLAPTAVLIGDVRVGDRASVWFGTVLRADLGPIEIGSRASVQDNAVLHVAEGRPTVVGDGVTVGHGALLEGCAVEEGAVIGMGAIALHEVRVGAGAVVAAGAVLPERSQVAPGTLVAGVPAREKGPVSGAARRWTQIATDDYQRLRELYLARSRGRPEPEQLTTSPT